MRLLFFSFFLYSNFLFGQLTTFTENFINRPFVLPNSIIEINSPVESVDFSINVDTNNILNHILPTHLGLNFPHFLGDNILDDNEFLTHTTNLSSMYYRIPGGSGSDRYFWDGNMPSNIRNDAQISLVLPCIASIKRSNPSLSNVLLV